MSQTLYFYDLETTGINSRDSRVMQFAGQRTTLDLKPIGEPHDFLLRIADDVLPDPDAIMITGITPQQTIADGMSEAEFLKIFMSEIATPGTIFTGFNSIRFDDEFMRFMLYRNFFDAYEWQWKDERSRWDLLDVVRMTRALRPEGLKWPVDSKGNATNRLELLTSINGLDHTNAHDALSDVRATIVLAQLIRDKQPKLFSYLLDLRDKKKIATLVNAGQPFVYTSGKYDNELDKTTVAVKVCEHPKKQGVIVYDLRFDPNEYIGLAPEKLVELWTKKWNEPGPRLPLKTLQFNRCPAVAPIGVLDSSSQKRLKLNLATITKHQEILKEHPTFCQSILSAIEIMDKKQQTRLLEFEQTVDQQLYDGFIGDQDKRVMQIVRDTAGQEAPAFKDQRLKELLPLYKARNYPKSLSPDERQQWDEFIASKLHSGKPSRIEKYFSRINELAAQTGTSDKHKYILEELKLYGESLL